MSHHYRGDGWSPVVDDLKSFSKKLRNIPRFGSARILYS